MTILEGSYLASGNLVGQKFIAFQDVTGGPWRICRLTFDFGQMNVGTPPVVIMATREEVLEYFSRNAAK